MPSTRERFAMPSETSTIQQSAPKPPPPPAPPSPPSLFELTKEPRPIKPTGLFHELLDGNHLVLHYDMLERPDLYDDQARELVDQLTDCRRRFDELGTVERQLLDTATLEYATKPPVPSHERDRRQMVKRATQQLEPLPDDAPGGPEESLPAFWWLR